MMFKPIIPVFIIIIVAVLVVIALIICIANRRFRKLSNFIRLGVMAMILFALLRPLIQIQGVEKTAYSNVVLYFIIDNTTSMSVEDENEKARIDVAKKDMAKIINSFDAPKVGIYTEDILIYRLMPVSSDVKIALSLAEELQGKQTSQSEGSNLNALLNSAGEEIKRYAKNNPQAEIIVFFMSDGENLPNDASGNKTLESSYFDSVSYGAVVGYGSAEGDKVPNIVSREVGKVTGYQRDLTNPYIMVDGENVISKYNEEYLQNAADTYGFTFGRTDSIDSMIEEAKKKADTSIKSFQETTNHDGAFETYWIFMMIAGILMLIEFSNDFNSLLAEREVKK